MGFVENVKNLFAPKIPKGQPVIDSSVLVEVGRQLVLWDGLGEASYNPSDIAIATYKKMTQDAEVKAGLSLIRFAALSRDYDIIWPNKEKDSKEADDDVIDFLKFNFENVEGRMEGALANVLTAIPYGFSVTERVFKIADDGKWQNKIVLKRLKGLDPETIEFKVDKYGNLIGVMQSTNEPENKVELNIENLIIYVNDPEFGNWYGNSRLRSVYKNWFIKDVLTKFWNIALERFGVPILVGTVPTPGDFQKMQTILDNLKFKSSITKNPGWEIAALETGIGRSSGGDFASAITYHNEQILKGLLIPVVLLSNPKAGSFALAKTQFDLFTIMLKQLERDIEKIIEDQLIKPLVRLNYDASATEFPQFRFKPMTKEDLLELSKAFALIVKNGIALPEESSLREMLGLPPLTTEDKSKLEKRNEQAIKKPASGFPNRPGGQSKTPKARTPR